MKTKKLILFLMLCISFQNIQAKYLRIQKVRFCHHIYIKTNDSWYILNKSKQLDMIHTNSICIEFYAPVTENQRLAIEKKWQLKPIRCYKNNKNQFQYCYELPETKNFFTYCKKILRSDFVNTIEFYNASWLG